MSAAEFDDLVERAAAIPLFREGDSLNSLVADFKRIIVVAALARNETVTQAAIDLDMTREGLTQLRKRLGIPAKPRDDGLIPPDWRERLEAAVRDSNNTSGELGRG